MCHGNSHGSRYMIWGTPFGSLQKNSVTGEGSLGPFFFFLSTATAGSWVQAVSAPDHSPKLARGAACSALFFSDRTDSTRLGNAQKAARPPKKHKCRCNWPAKSAALARGVANTNFDVGSKRREKKAMRSPCLPRYPATRE